MLFNTFKNPGSLLTAVESRKDGAESGLFMLLPLKALGPIRWAFAAFDGVKVTALPELMSPWAGPYVNVAMTL